MNVIAVFTVSSEYTRAYTQTHTRTISGAVFGFSSHSKPHPSRGSVFFGLCKKLGPKQNTKENI